MGDPKFWANIQLPKGADKEYVCVGVKASNYFMPKETLSEKGPGGGGWIHMDMTLAVETKDGQVWSADEKGFARIYAVGDCNYACVPTDKKPPSEWEVPPIPKISYPGEEEALIACKNIQLPKGADKEYVCVGVKASNYFMPKETLSEKGPGGGGWIHMDMTLAVETKDGQVW